MIPAECAASSASAISIESVRSSLQRTPGDAMLQHDAIQKLHGDERLLATFADLVNCADVGMVEGGGCASFTPETFQSLRITGNVVGQELQGDEAAKLGVLGLVDHTHSAAAQFLQDAIVRNGLAQQEKRRSDLGRKS